MKLKRLIAVINVGTDEYYATEIVPVVSSSKEDFLMELELAFEAAVLATKTFEKRRVAAEKPVKELLAMSLEDRALYYEKIRKIEEERKTVTSVEAGGTAFNIECLKTDLENTYCFQAPQIFELEEWFNANIKIDPKLFS